MIGKNKESPIFLIYNNITMESSPCILMNTGMGKTFCPIQTEGQGSLQESWSTPMDEIKAYKLGKRRWSYNQIELVVMEKDGDKKLFSKQAIHEGVARPELGDSGGIAYQITLSNDEVIRLEVFLVYDAAHPSAMHSEKSTNYSWVLVSRAACKRGCEGPTLRAIQRFGKLGKRSGTTPSPSPRGLDRTSSNMKDSRYMYISLDEAVTHVGCRCFRLMSAAYNANGEVIGANVSPPVRVLANNDVPTGAAQMELYVEVNSSWPGWQSCLAPTQLQFSPSAREISYQSGGTSFQNISPIPQPTNRLDRTTSGHKRLAQEEREAEMERSLEQFNLLKKGRMAEGNERRTINLTANATRHGVSPFNTRHDRSILYHANVEENNLKSLHADGSLALWLDDLNNEARFQTETQYLPRHQDSNLNSNTDYRDPSFSIYANRIEQPTTSKYSRAQDDPVTAFVQLMMAQSPPSEHMPVVQIPQLYQEDHPQRNVFESKLFDVRSNGMRPESPHIVQNLGGTPPSNSTPSGSGLDSLLCGIHASKLTKVVVLMHGPLLTDCLLLSPVAAFDSLIQDDAIYPPSRLPKPPTMS